MHIKHLGHGLVSGFYHELRLDVPNHDFKVLVGIFLV